MKLYRNFYIVLGRKGVNWENYKDFERNQRKDFIKGKILCVKKKFDIGYQYFELINMVEE